MGPVISVLDSPVLLHVAQSSRQSGHHSQVVGSFSSRLMSPDSIEIRISDNSNNPHAAGSAGSRRRRRRSCARWCLLAPPESRTVAPQACAHPQRPAHVVDGPEQHLCGAAGCPQPGGSPTVVTRWLASCCRPPDALLPFAAGLQGVLQKFTFLLRVLGGKVASCRTRAALTWWAAWHARGARPERRIYQLAGRLTGSPLAMATGRGARAGAIGRRKQTAHNSPRAPSLSVFVLFFSHLATPWEV